MDKIDFKELARDENFIKKMKEFDVAVDKIDEMLKLLENPNLYEDLSNIDKIEYNLLLSFTLNSLFWMYLKTEGCDPTKLPIKSENERLRKSMMRAQKIKDKSLRPRVNKAAAGRFVRSGLWDPKNGPNDDGELEPEPRPGDILEENWESGP